MASQDQFYRPADENKGVADSMKDKTMEVKEKTGQKAHETREKAGGTTESAKEQAKGALQQTGEKVKQMAETTAQTVKNAFGAGQPNPNDPARSSDDAYLSGAAAGDDVTGNPKY